MASRDLSDHSWFHDSEQLRSAGVHDVSPEELIRRPWKAMWPPRSTKSLEAWLRSEFPEVLSWRFDPDRPFDQPWREWLKSPSLKDEGRRFPSKYGSKNQDRAEPTKSGLVSTVSMDPHDEVARFPKIQIDFFKYLAPLDAYKTEKLFFSQLPCGTHLPRTNLVESNHTVDIHDISGQEDMFKLDEAGFQFMRIPTKTLTWTDETVQNNYLPELSEWLKQYFSCERVFIYNYNLRTNDMRESGTGPWRSPIFRVHCDNTSDSCAERLKFQFPSEAEAILQGRYRYIDVWRCLNGQDVDSPLALCDYRTIATTDLWKIDIVYPHFSEEGYEVTYSRNHRWYYKKRMSKDDVVLFKLGDSLRATAQFAPHAAFIDPSAPRDHKRASIEVRAMIIG